LTDSWTAKASIIGPARTSAVGFSIGNFGYIGTGQTNMGSTNDFYQYNPIANQWVLKSPVGPTTRQEAAGFAVNGLGYIGTGDDYSSGNNFGDMWEYDPALNLWVQIEDFAGTARRYLTAFVIGSRAYAGTGTNGTNFRDFWMFDQILSVLTRKMEETNIIIYPNPASELIKFELKDLPDFIYTKNISVDLYSLSGQSKGSYNFDTPSKLIDVSHLQTGQYVYKLNYEGRSFKTGKIIIAH
jgi:N-acetylneuraminic acid mutarotase